MTSALSWPYGHQYASAWGAQTSTVNFCETDYYISPYIAEFINTISNFSYLVLAWYGWRNTSKHTGDNAMLSSYAQLAFVGVGSTVFHATLKFSGQIADEMAMLYATATAIYALVGVRLELLQRIVLGIALTVAVTIITIAHVYQDNSNMHRLCFAFMVIGVAARCRWLICELKSSPTKRDVAFLAIVGSIIFVSGYGLWLVDEHFCSVLQRWRAALGIPFGFLLELHGWWHVLTAIGVYYYLLLVERLRLCSQHALSLNDNDIRVSFNMLGIPSLHFPRPLIQPSSNLVLK
ncbi:alkaline phytoceramidase [Xylona heveae TC161]|uniref:Alkaline phytoceramidase n=1 Tax=Xylona heveae (strain CBS 132557 / TC161) TaxID=1328760 RepID=A0A161TNR8_XYLHT|nr:alkaline phytoceramidase [Xylona heveae TC161]KZF22886.1 alkaline phytoceramidase [Xylona heveae TC161]